MRRNTVFFLFTFLLTFQISNVIPATAITYQWTDAQGKIHTTDDPEQIPPGVVPLPIKGQKSLTKEKSISKPLRSAKSSQKDMVLIPAGTYERYAPAKRMFKVKSKKGNILWISNLTAGYAVTTGEKADFLDNHVVPLKIGNALWVTFNLPKVDYADPLEIDYVIQFPNEIILEGKKTHQIRIHDEYNAAYIGLEPGGTGWMFDEKDDPALLQTGEWSIILVNKGKEIASVKFLVVKPGKENEVDEATARALKGLVAYKVSVDPFYMDRHEVTRKQFHEVMGYLPSLGGSDKPIKKESENLPVDLIQWEAAQKFCHKIGKHLPTEAEWEWAAHGGENTPYPWGRNMVEGQANFCDRNCSGEHSSNNWNDGFAKFAPVGSFPPNGYGLYDMVGNLSEWVSDWYDPDYYANAPEKNPVGPSIGQQKVYRGGSYWSTVSDMKISVRSSGFIYMSRGPQGFRCALSTNGTLEQIAQARYLKGKPKATSRDYESMTPINRVSWKARDALHHLNKACKRFWKEQGKEKSCTVKRVTGTEYGFDNPNRLSIQAGGTQKDFKASITQIEDNFRGKKENITYILDTQRDWVKQEPRKNITHVRATVGHKNSDQYLQMIHEEQIAGTSCGTQRVPIAMADWECLPSGESIVKLHEEKILFCSRPYFCRKASPQEEKRLFNQKSAHKIIVALNRLKLVCREFFDSEGTKGNCSKKDLDSRILLHYKNVKITFHGKGENLKVTATKQWKDKEGMDIEKTYDMNHKGEITPMDYR